MTRPEQLIALAKPFPAALVSPAPKGKFGDYVAHSTVTERLLHEVGPFDFRITDIIRSPDGRIVGCIGELTVTVDGRVTVVQEAGSEEHPDNQNDGENLKRAASDALKRCAMRLGVGLHLWSGPAYYLDKQLAKQWPPAAEQLPLEEA